MVTEKRISRMKKTFFIDNVKNMFVISTIGNRGFVMYKKYRYSYEHISNSISNIINWFAAFERLVSLQSNL